MTKNKNLDNLNEDIRNKIILKYKRESNIGKLANKFNTSPSIIELIIKLHKINAPYISSYVEAVDYLRSHSKKI